MRHWRQRIGTAVRESVELTALWSLVVDGAWILGVVPRQVSLCLPLPSCFEIPPDPSQSDPLTVPPGCWTLFPSAFRLIVFTLSQGENTTASELNEGNCTATPPPTPGPTAAFDMCESFRPCLNGGICSSTGGYVSSLDPPPLVSIVCTAATEEFGVPSLNRQENIHVLRACWLRACSFLK